MSDDQLRGALQLASRDNERAPFDAAGALQAGRSRLRQRRRVRTASAGIAVAAAVGVAATLPGSLGDLFGQRAEPGPGTAPTVSDSVVYEQCAVPASEFIGFSGDPTGIGAAEFKKWRIQAVQGDAGTFAAILVSPTGDRFFGCGFDRGVAWREGLHSVVPSPELATSGAFVLRMPTGLMVLGGQLPDGATRVSLTTSDGKVSDATIADDFYVWRQRGSDEATAEFYDASGNRLDSAPVPEGRAGSIPWREPEPGPGCEQWCFGDQPSDVAKPIGAVVDTGDTVNGVPVLLFADGKADPLTGARGATIRVGYRHPDTGELLASGGWFRPSSAERGEFVIGSFGAPSSGSLLLDHLDEGRCHDKPCGWSLYGAVVDSNVTSVSAVAADGTQVDVHLSDKEVAPGLRVFWASGRATSKSLAGVVLRLHDAAGSVVRTCALSDDDCVVEPGGHPGGQ